MITSCQLQECQLQETVNNQSGHGLKLKLTQKGRSHTLNCTKNNAEYQILS